MVDVSMTAEVPEWAETVLNYLARNGPAPVDELAEIAGETPAEVEDQLDLMPQVWETDSGWVSLYAVAEGRIWTHRLEPGEIEAQRISSGVDLTMIDALAELNPLPLAKGGEVESAWSSSPCPDCGEEHDRADRTLTGPDGWLADYRPDDLIGLRIRDGQLALEPVDHSEVEANARVAESAVLDGLVDAAQAAVEACLEAYDDDLGWSDIDLPETSVQAALIRSLMHDDDLFRRPIRPLSDVLRTDRLDLDDDVIFLPEVTERWAELTPGELSERVNVLGLLRAENKDRVPEVIAGLAGSDELLLEAAEWAERRGFSLDYLAALRSAAGTDQERAAADLLAARVREREGRVDEAYDLLAAAAALNTGLRPVDRAAAEFLAGRGTPDTVGTAKARRAGAEAAVRLLERADAGTHAPGLDIFRSLLTPPIGTQSRNAPCTCGSGKKYKACCLVDEIHPLPVRAAVLYELLRMFVGRASRLEHLIEIMMAAGPAQARSLPDLAIFSSGAVDEFLAQRGHWLFDDERELVEGWQRVPLALYEVISTGPGRTVTVRRLPDGERLAISNSGLASTARRLDLFLMRPLWDGKRFTIYNDPFSVPRFRRAELLRLLETDPDGRAIAAFFGPQPPPRLVNTDGHELLDCSATYQLGDGEWESLPDGWSYDDEGDIVVQQSVEGQTLVTGRLRRVGDDRWRVEANSIERLRALQSVLSSVAPSAQLITESTVPFDTTTSAGRPSGTSIGHHPPGPEEQAALEEFVRQRERQWIDESIPALDGRTPRECVAAGGTSLADLRALLDDFEAAERDGESMMSVARLRDLLGLSLG